MSDITSKEFVDKQYKDASKLQIRIDFYKKNSTNKQKFSEWLFNNYEIKDGARILELGSRTGELWEGKIDTLPKDVHITLSDYSNGIVEELDNKINFTNVDIKRIDIMDIPYPDNTFDIVIANYVFFFVTDLDKAISEVARVLKYDGVFYSATTGKNGTREFIINTLSEFDSQVKKPQKLKFRMDNGSEFLEKHFKNIDRNIYRNDVHVADTNDLIDYIYSSGAYEEMVEKYSKKDLYNFYENKKDKDGVIKINIEAGTFISKK